MIQELLATIIGQMAAEMAINPRGLHGLSHWARVYDNGLRLAAETGADRLVVELFALFHDSRRLTEHADPNHGPRGAALAEQYHRDGLLRLDEERLCLLLTACRLHTAARTHDETTVRTCFDADRLDLARTGTTVNPDFLCTDAARDPRLIAWASGRSLAGIVPDNIVGQALHALPAATP
ncbi:MAG: hypothetical protein LBD10_09485 [Desulfobulbus sp.]|jgi:uncharacterized protein|uniref:hypothetical protein n=1 Tax=Desulfobulbus sp. TaxID=895 RepID=UPI0028485748|nr:hypothetical protein [Desulfobulbus sp.]MDR2550413.1 hypothetical protein [Desulfobulbus sp.]